MAHGMSAAVADFSAYSRHELGLPEVREMSRGEKHWGFVDGMFLGGNDDMIALRLLKGHGYESVTRELWKRCCKNAKLVADIGTHSGIFTLDAYRAGAKMVFAAEPNPINYARLVMNLRYNKFSVGGAFYGAIGDENKVGSLLVKGGLWHVYAGGRMDMDNANGMRIPVRTARLDAILPPETWHELKALKIDAENYTPKVIDGMEEIFAAGNRPDMIIECLDGGMGEKLRRLGYRFWRIWETGTIEEADDLLPSNSTNNYNKVDDICRNRFASVTGLPAEMTDGGV